MKWKGESEDSKYKKNSTPSLLNTKESSDTTLHIFIQQSYASKLLG